MTSTARRRPMPGIDPHVLLPGEGARRRRRRRGTARRLVWLAVALAVGGTTALWLYGTTAAEPAAVDGAAPPAVPDPVSGGHPLGHGNLGLPPPDGAPAPPPPPS